MAKYIITERQRDAAGIGGKAKLREGKVYLISEYHYNYLSRILNEEIKPLNPRQKSELVSAGYDANLVVDINGYDFILDLLSDKAKRMFTAIGYRGMETLTNRDLTQEKVMSSLAGLNVKKERKASSPTITGINAKRPVVLPAGGRDLRKKVQIKKQGDRAHNFDISNADVKIDTRTYEDGSSTYIISPLSQVWKDKLGSKKFSATQDDIRGLLGRFKAEGAKVLAEGVMESNQGAHKVSLLDNDVLALTFLPEDINSLEPYFEKDIEDYNNSAAGWHDNTNVENAITALLKNRNISISEDTLKIIAQLVFDYFR